MRTETNDIYLGFFVSLGVHGVLLLLLIGWFSSPWKFEDQVVYSVTIEGGKALGGVSQVAQEKPKTEAPYKKVEEAAPKETKSAEKPDVVLPSEKAKDKNKEQDKDKKASEKKKEEDKKRTDKKKSEESQADIDRKYQQAMKKWLGESSDAGGKGYGAAKISGEQGMGGGVLRPPEFFAYKKVIEDKIKKGWNWFDTSAALVTKVEFDIAEDGAISNIRIGQGSGNYEYDDSVERAVAKANPLPAPPASVYQFFKSVRMTFDPRDTL